MPALPQRFGKTQRRRSAAVLGRINPMTDPASVSITYTGRPNIDRLGAGKNARTPAAIRKNPTALGARPSPASSTRLPILYQFGSRKPGVRTFTGWGRARMPALPQRFGKTQGRRERGRPRPHQADYRSCTSLDHVNRAPERSPAGAGKNARAPAARRKPQRHGERGRPRPHQADDRSWTSFGHVNRAPERSPAGGGQECPRSRSASEKPSGAGSAAVPGRVRPTTDLTRVSITQSILMDRRVGEYK